jgi:hypothetical protein
MGRLPVTGVSPFAAMEFVSAVAMSDSVLLAHVELIDVPVTTGLLAARE